MVLCFGEVHHINTIQYNSPIIFKMQKRVIGIIMGHGYRESCRGLFKELKILTLALQYIFSLLLFVVHNKGYFASNIVYHKFNTRPF
jgi:hypothetical protein